MDDWNLTGENGGSAQQGTGAPTGVPPSFVYVERDGRPRRYALRLDTGSALVPVRLLIGTGEGYMRC